MNGWKEAHCIYQLMNHHQGFAFLLYNNCLIFIYNLSQIISSIKFWWFLIVIHIPVEKKIQLKLIKAYIGILGRIQTIRLKNLKQIIGHSQSFRPWSLSSVMVYLSARTDERGGSCIKLGQGLWQRTKGSMSGYTKTNISVDYLMVLCQCLIIQPNPDILKFKGPFKLF